MEKDISNLMHKYPYGVKDFFANANNSEYGLANALSEDWYMTRERLMRGISEDLLGSVILSIFTVPLDLYATYRIYKETKRLRNRALKTIKQGTGTGNSPVV
jgi:hypothetical protein